MGIHSSMSVVRPSCQSRGQHSAQDFIATRNSIGARRVAAPAPDVSGVLSKAATASFQEAAVGAGRMLEGKGL